MLESYIREKQRDKGILVMAHMVVGYPSLEKCLRLVYAMVESGVDLLELQIPFSEPIADGPVIQRANHSALQSGVTVEDCLAITEEIGQCIDVPAIVMTYYNIVFRYGIEAFVARMAKAGIRGALLPDLPPQEAHDYVAAMKRAGLAPIFTFAPTTPENRMRFIASKAKGFIYCVARKGVTGHKTRFSNEIFSYLAKCRAWTSLPLAVGFGIKEAEDLELLKGRVEVAVVGTKLIELIEEQGLEGVQGFLQEFCRLAAVKKE